MLCIPSQSHSRRRNLDGGVEDRIKRAREGGAHKHVKGRGHKVVRESGEVRYKSKVGSQGVWSGRGEQSGVM